MITLTDLFVSSWSRKSLVHPISHKPRTLSDLIGLKNPVCLNAKSEQIGLHFGNLFLFLGVWDSLSWSPVRHGYTRHEGILKTTKLYFKLVHHCSFFQYPFFNRKCQQLNVSVGICMLKVNNRNTRTRCEISSKLTIKHQNVIIYVVLVSLLLTLNIFNTLF